MNAGESVLANEATRGGDKVKMTAIELSNQTEDTEQVKAEKGTN